MRIAIGLKAHSGWAALVAVGYSGSRFQLVDRRRIELVEPEDLAWAKQPYHAAEHLPIDAANDLVQRAIASADSIAATQMRAVVERAIASGHDIAGCAVLVGSPMPEWSTSQILAVHIRMHKAEGALFPDALVRAARACGLHVLEIREKGLGALATESFSPATIAGLEALGRQAGPPWGKDQKQAALAALHVLAAS